MSYPPPQQQPPVVAGAQQPTNWSPVPTPPAPPRKSRAVPLLIGVVVLLVAAVGALAVVLLRGSGDDGPAGTGPVASPAATVTTTAPTVEPATPASFSSAEELRAALVAGGIACDNAELIKHDGKGPVGLVDDTISCYRDRAELDLDVYDSAENASGRVAYQAALLEGFGLDPGWFAVGENWTVQCETRTDCEDVTAAIGGRVESTE